MKTVFAAAAALLMLSGAAFAQANAVIDPETLPENRAIDQQYRSSLNRLPDPSASGDPWRSVRSDEKADKPADNKSKQVSGKKTKTAN